MGETQIIRKFTTPAHFPRSDSRSVQYRDAKLDIVYSVHSRVLPTEPPSKTKFNLVFLHGAQFTKEVWYYVIDRCFDYWGDQLDKCIALDHVHHGDSAFLNRSKVGYFIPWDDQGRDTACVIRDCINRGEIDIAAPLIVVAHSMSGTSAMALSVFEPGLVNALVLIDAVWMGNGITHDHLDIMSGKFARMAASSYKRTKDTFKNLEDYRNYMENDSIYTAMDPRIKKDVFSNLYHTDPDGTVHLKMERAIQCASYYSGLSAVGVGESLVKRVRLPVLIVHGPIADFNTAGINEILEESLPNAERKMIDNTGHLVCYTHPDLFFDAIKDFITKQYKAGVEHVRKVDSEWGPSANERFLKQLKFHEEGNLSAEFSRL